MQTNFNILANKLIKVEEVLEEEVEDRVVVPRGVEVLRHGRGSRGAAVDTLRSE